MSDLNEKRFDRILLVGKELNDVELINEWLIELAQVTHVSDTNNLENLLNKQSWDLIIADMSFSELENQGILKIAINALEQIFLLIFRSDNNANENLFKKTAPHNIAVLYKPLEKHSFLEAVFNFKSTSLNRRRKTDRRKHKQDVALFIGAHPDDVEIASGGCIAKHQARGDSIHILTLSSGESGGDFVMRREEAKKAADILQANLFINELVDTKITHVETIHLIDEVVKQITPTHVYTHSIHDAHQDHRNVYHASVVACRGVPNLYCYQSPSSTIYFHPNLFMEISDHIDQKLMALAVYKSQVSKRPYLQEDMIRATARYWGRYSNYGLAEPMEIIRET